MFHVLTPPDKSTSGSHLHARKIGGDSGEETEDRKRRKMRQQQDAQRRCTQPVHCGNRGGSGGHVERRKKKHLRLMFECEGRGAGKR